MTIQLFCFSLNCDSCSSWWIFPATIITVLFSCCVFAAFFLLLLTGILQRRVLFSISLFNLLLISVFQMYGYSFYSMGCTVFILLIKLFQLWPLEGLSGWLLCLLKMPPFSLEDYLTFWHRKVLQVYLVFSMPTFGNQPLLQGALTDIKMIIHT